MAYDPIALGIVPCDCGRLSNKIHCPFCGSYDIRGRAKKNKRVHPTNGIEEEYQVFKCRVCFKFFDDFEWQNDCRAPEYISPTARQQRQLRQEFKNSPQMLSKLDELERKQQLNAMQRAADDLARKHGIDPEKGRII